jgi:ADP-heptose:LPS heptosyltransferase
LYKNYTLTLCGNEEWRDIAETFDGSYIDNYIWINKKRFERSWFYRIKTYCKIHCHGYELLIHPTLTRDFPSDMLVKACYARNKIACISDSSDMLIKGRENINCQYDLLLPISGNYIFEFERNKEFFEKLIGTRISLKKPFIDANNINTVISGQKYFAVSPGAGKEKRRWSTTFYAQIVNYIFYKYHLIPVIVGSNDEIKLSDEIINQSNLSTIVNLTGRINLVQLVKVIKDAQLLVCNDTSVVHFSASLNTKVVCISNGNNFGRFVPYPQRIFNRMECVFPQEISLSEALFQTQVERYAVRSDLNINTICVDLVKQSIDSLLRGCER